MEREISWYKKKSQPEKNQEPAFHPLFVNPKKVEFENVFIATATVITLSFNGKLLDMSYDYYRAFKFLEQK